MPPSAGSRRRKRLSREAKPWPERPVSEANKSGTQIVRKQEPCLSARLLGF